MHLKKAYARFSEIIRQLYFAITNKHIAYYTGIDRNSEENWISIKIFIWKFSKYSYIVILANEKPVRWNQTWQVFEGQLRTLLFLHIDA